MENDILRTSAKKILFSIRHKRLLLITCILIVASTLGYIGFRWQQNARAAAVEFASSTETSTPSQPLLTTMIAGSDDSDHGNALSWPGEVVSLGEIEIQPQREGTIVEWLVHIGERVSAGQAVARLSAPPAMPELTAMLALLR